MAPLVFNNPPLITVISEDNAIIAGNFGEVAFAQDFPFSDGLVLEIVAIRNGADSTAQVEHQARRRRSEHEPLVSGVPLWRVTFVRKNNVANVDEYELHVRRLANCTKYEECCGELKFIGKPKNQKSFRGQKLREGSFIPTLDNLGFRCFCTSSVRKGHHRADAYAWCQLRGDTRVVLSNAFTIKGRPTGSKKLRGEDEIDCDALSPARHSRPSSACDVFVRPTVPMSPAMTPRRPSTCSSSAECSDSEAEDMRRFGRVQPPPSFFYYRMYPAPLPTPPPQSPRTGSFTYVPHVPVYQHPHGPAPVQHQVVPVVPTYDLEKAAMRSKRKLEMDDDEQHNAAAALLSLGRH